VASALLRSHGVRIRAVLSLSFPGQIREPNPVKRPVSHRRNRILARGMGVVAGSGAVGALLALVPCGLHAASLGQDGDGDFSAGSQEAESSWFSIPETSAEAPTRPLRLSSGPIKRGTGGVIGAINGQFFETNGPVSFSVQAWLPHETHPGSRRYSVDHIEGGLTVDLVPWAKMRLGHFDALGGREEFVAIQQYSYFEFNPPAQQMMLERLVSPGQSDAMTRHLLPRGAGAFSELGFQVYDSMDTGDWENSYAVMLGNGGRFSGSEYALQPELTGYWSSTWLSGDWRSPGDGLKLFGWGQRGEREVSAAGAGLSFQSRWGMGTSFRRGRWRSSLEYIGADGLSSTHGFAGGATLPSGSGTTWGWSWDTAYQVHPLCELALRFDEVFRNFGDVRGRLDTLTFGAQVLLGKDLRGLLNYELHWPEGLGSGSSDRGTGIEHLIAAQLAFSF
jgi:hypothetical protein